MMHDVKKTAAENLRTLLAETGITQKELAAKIGVHPVTVSKWANARMRMRLSNANDIHAIWSEYPIGWLRGDCPNRMAVGMMSKPNVKMRYLKDIGWCRANDMARFDSMCLRCAFSVKLGSCWWCVYQG